MSFKIKDWSCSVTQIPTPKKRRLIWHQWILTKLMTSKVYLISMCPLYILYLFSSNSTTIQQNPTHYKVINFIHWYDAVPGRLEGWRSGRQRRDGKQSSMNGQVWSLQTLRVSLNTLGSMEKGCHVPIWQCPLKEHVALQRVESPLSSRQVSPSVRYPLNKDAT